MALLAALAVAVAAWFPAAAQGAALLPVLAVALLVGPGVTATRRSTRLLPAGRDVWVLTAVTVVGFVALYVAGWTDRAHQDDVARLLPWAVALLGVLWPQPNVLRYCLLLDTGALLGATVTGEAVTARWAVGGALVAMAVAVVATNRLSAAGAPRLGPPAAARGRRVIGEAALLLAAVGLLAALAASLLPPPAGQGGGQGRGGGRGPTLLRPAAPAVDFGDRFDVGAGHGRRGNEVVLVVNAAAPDLWRATTYDHWDGEAWSRSPETLAPVDTRVAPGVGDVEAEQDSDLLQRVTVQARALSLLVAAARPSLVVGGAPVDQGRDGSLHPAVPLTRGDTYVVDSRRSFPGPEALRSAAGTIPTDVADAYLQLPEVPARVRALAAEIAAGAPTAYDQARAVERWLGDNTTVTDDARPEPLDAFLLDSRSGPPERTATAMAVMLRALGVPARIAVGFLPGTRGRDGAFVVRSRDTHAWVEVWFPGIGWQRFDPTGRAPAPEPKAESVWDRLWRFLRQLWPLLAAVLLLALAGLAWFGVRWWRRQQARPWAVRLLARLERAGAVRGRPRRPQETPAEYAGELSRTVLPDPRLEEVGELVTVGAYAAHDPPAADRARAEEVLQAATRAAPVRRLRPVHRWPTRPRPTIREP